MPSGFAFAKSANSLADFTGMSARTTRTSGVFTTTVIGAKSRTGS